MKLMDERQILDLEYRKAVIDEIMAPENQARKAEHWRRYEIYKDRTARYVYEHLKRVYKNPETLKEMERHLENLSVYKKVINKLARVYSGGVDRDLGSDEASVLYQLMKIDTQMRKADRYRESHKNAWLHVVPFRDYTEGNPDNPRYKIKLKVHGPHEYDVLEDAEDREVPRVVILNEALDDVPYSAASESRAGFHPAGRPTQASNRDYKDNRLADNRRDDSSRECFIWWSDSYHFTTNAKGEIIAEKSPEDGLNPIGMLPGVHVAEDQDGFFWAEGGDDLVDGAISINGELTDLNYITWLQGFGQLVITGSDIPSTIKVGPQNVICIEYDKETQAQPSVDVLSHNPPIEARLRKIEQKTALLLTTNDLSPNTVSTKLDATNPAAGIALLIENSEAINNLEDKRAEFVAVERDLYPVIASWQNLYAERGWLVNDFQALGQLPIDADVQVRFRELKPAITDAQRLADMKSRKDLGIASAVDLIMMDNPDMTREQAEEKLAQIREEKQGNMAMFSAMTQANAEESEDDDESEDDAAQ